MESVIYTTGYQVPMACKHCGKWHYGKSKLSREVAERHAANEVEKCRRSYETMGWPDEGLPEDAESDAGGAPWPI